MSSSFLHPIPVDPGDEENWRELERWIRAVGITGVVGPPGPPGPGGVGPAGPAGPAGADGIVGGSFYTTTMGDGIAKVFAVTHNLGTVGVQVFVYRTASPFDEVEADIEHTDANTVTVRVQVAPAPNELTVAVSGPGSVGGALDLTYIHTQSTPAATWNVAHNLGKYPAVDVVDTGNSVVIPSVLYVDGNNVQLLFGSATSGKAYVN